MTDNPLRFDLMLMGEIIGTYTHFDEMEIECTPFYNFRPVEKYAQYMPKADNVTVNWISGWVEGFISDDRDDFGEPGETREVFTVKFLDIYRRITFPPLEIVHAPMTAVSANVTVEDATSAESMDMKMFRNRLERLVTYE